MTATPIPDDIENLATAVRNHGITATVIPGERMVVESREIGHYSRAVIRLVNGEFRWEWPDGDHTTIGPSADLETNVANVYRVVTGDYLNPPPASTAT